MLTSSSNGCYGSNMPKPTIEETFDQQYIVDPVTGCHVWQRCLDKDGYGKLWVGGKKGKLSMAHRHAYERKHGPLPPELKACHKCDNPPCVNVAHLFPGTNSDNMMDAHAKGRMVSPVFRGEEHGMAILTKAQVLDIRARIAAGERQVDVAKSHGISAALAYRIKKRIIWKHV